MFGEKAQIIAEERRKVVLDLYKQGKSRPEISKVTGASAKTILRDLRVMAEMGIIEPIDVCKGKPLNGKRKQRTFKPKPIITEDLKEGEWVECTLEVSKRCLYGVQELEKNGLCSYILCTSEKRGCPHNHCTKFVKSNRKAKQII